MLAAWVFNGYCMVTVRRSNGYLKSALDLKKALWISSRYKVMKSGYPDITRVLTFNLFVLFTSAAIQIPASAQGYEMSRGQPQVTVSSGPYPDIGRPYSVRVTTGYHTVSGWENNLVKSDPNLRRWTWVPIGSADQAYIHVAPGQYAKHLPVQPPQRPKSCYVKPIHVPLPDINYGRPEPLKAEHIATARSDNTNVCLSGKLKLSKQEPNPAGRTRTLSYGNGYGDITGRLHPSLSSAITENKSVHGKLMMQP